MVKKCYGALGLYRKLTHSQYKNNSSWWPLDSKDHLLLMVSLWESSHIQGGYLNFQQKEVEGALVQGMTVHAPGDYICEAWRSICLNNVFRAHYSDSKNFKLLWHWQTSGFLCEAAVRSASQRLQWLLCPFLIRYRLTVYSGEWQWVREMKEISRPFLDGLKRYLFFAAMHIHITFGTFEDNLCMLLLHTDTLCYICCILVCWYLVCICRKPGASIGSCIFDTC